MLNFNGLDILKECFPSVVEASRKGSTPLTVIDNCSADDSLSWLSQNYPQARVVTAKENRVLCSFNEAVKSSTADIVILLNNDLKLHPDFIEPLIKDIDTHEDDFFSTAHLAS